jgi:hypothetical protein
MKLLKILASLMLGVTLSTAVMAQSDPVADSLAGPWAGTLIIGRDEFDMTFTFTQDEDTFSAALISRQLGIYGMPAESVRIANNRLTIRLDILAAEYTGRLRLNEDGTGIAFIDGEWFQEGEMVPIILRRPDAR